MGITAKSASNSSLGTTILVSATGRTLYHYRADTKTSAKCNGSCATQWPPLLIAAGHKPVAGPGVTASKLGMVMRADGKMQVTYAGYPLYRFAGDTKAGQVNGQGLGGLWHVVAASGALVMKAAAKASSGDSMGGGATTTTTTTTSGGGGGYGY
jgi:predicted lipoprotein with Yx(FWY)xxD motif